MLPIFRVRLREPGFGTGRAGSGTSGVVASLLLGAALGGLPSPSPGVRGGSRPDRLRCVHARHWEGRGRAPSDGNTESVTKRDNIVDTLWAAVTDTAVDTAVAAMEAARAGDRRNRASRELFPCRFLARMTPNRSPTREGVRDARWIDNRAGDRHARDRHLC